MAERIRIRARVKDGITEVLALLSHPMESGFRPDDQGVLQAAHYITEVRVVLGERMVLEARLSPAVSQDPLLSFRFRGGQPGDRLEVAWTDNLGQSRRDSAVLS